MGIWLRNIVNIISDGQGTLEPNNRNISEDFFVILLCTPDDFLAFTLFVNQPFAVFCTKARAREPPAPRERLHKISTYILRLMCTCVTGRGFELKGLIPFYAGADPEIFDPRKLNVIVHHIFIG